MDTTMWNLEGEKNTRCYCDWTENRGKNAGLVASMVSKKDFEAVGLIPADNYPFDEN